MEYNKKFVIIGNTSNAPTYKEVFPLIKDKRIWLGVNSVKEFRTPNNNGKSTWDKTRQGWFQKFGNVGWFTNLDHKKRHEKLILHKKYTPNQYPHYDNYNAINVDRVADIPEDYKGVMGVPITFLDKHNPEQFEIVDQTKYQIPGHNKYDRGYIGGRRLYDRIWIKKVQ